MKSLISNYLYLHLMVTAEQEAETSLLLQGQVNIHSTPAKFRTEGCRMKFFNSLIPNPDKLLERQRRKKSSMVTGWPESPCTPVSSLYQVLILRERPARTVASGGILKKQIITETAQNNPSPMCFPNSFLPVLEYTKCIHQAASPNVFEYPINCLN